MSFAEADADGMPALLTPPGELQMTPVVRVADGQAPVGALLKAERGAGLVLLDLADDEQFRGGRQCFGHGCSFGS